MSSTDQIKPAGKSGKRKRKGAAAKKADAVETQAPVQLQSPEPQPEPSEPVPAEIATVAEVATEIATVAEVAPEPTVTTQPADTIPVEVPQPVASAPSEPASVSLQTIANAYRDYTRKSFEQFGSFFEQLSGVRSLDKAMTVQTEFMKRAYETSVSESQKICELHSRLARQTFQPFRGLVGKAPEAGGKS